MDIGLLGALSDLPAKTILEKDEVFVEFKGALTEHLIRLIITEPKNQLLNKIL